MSSYKVNDEGRGARCRDNYFDNNKLSFKPRPLKSPVTGKKLCRGSYFKYNQYTTQLLFMVTSADICRVGLVMILSIGTLGPDELERKIDYQMSQTI